MEHQNHCGLVMPGVDKALVNFRVVRRTDFPTPEEQKEIDEINKCLEQIRKGAIQIKKGVEERKINDDIFMKHMRVMNMRGNE